MNIIDLLDLVIDQEEQAEETFELEPLYLEYEQIRPQDLPPTWPADPFPKPPPNRRGSSEKKVIILDI